MKKVIQLKDWKICFYAKITDSEHTDIRGKFGTLSMTEAMIDKAEENLRFANRGTTIANNTKKHILVLISEQTDKAEMINTLSHEVRHVVDIICSECGLEHAAHLTGEIMARLSEWI